ncbi:MAG: tRNA pseudouridine(55) synthase TruB [Pseudohongiella sp.]|nr:tRNA pseudouridine(55) synthase TruB [Pseudohongiella sp.]
MSSGRKQKGRNINGILLLDKPQGMSSNACLQQAKHLFQVSKAGHTGALDPLATGVLPLCFGEATKVSQFLLEADKRYLTRIRLGERTDTADAEGSVISTRPAGDITRDMVLNALSQFRGEILQCPPMYSALKHNGQPLYKLARAGLEIERKLRPVTIHELILRDFFSSSVGNPVSSPENSPDSAGQWPELLLEIRCSKGTYVRTIADDLGEALGCGGHVRELRRLQAGVFRIEDCITPAALQASYAEGGLDAIDALLRPADMAIDHLPRVSLSSELALFVRQGQAVMVRPAPASELVRLYDNEEFIGIGAVLDDGRVTPRRLMREQAR